MATESFTTQPTFNEKNVTNLIKALENNQKPQLMEVDFETLNNKEAIEQFVTKLRKQLQSRKGESMEYCKLTDKYNNGTFVFFNKKENEYNAIVIKNKNYKLKYISLVPYYLDGELYEAYKELSEDDFHFELSKVLKPSNLNKLFEYIKS